MKKNQEINPAFDGTSTGPAYRNKTRILSLVGMVLCCGVLSLELTGLLHSNNIKIGSDFIILGLSMLLFIKPEKVYLLSFIFMIAAVINLIYGGNILGLLFYAMAMGIALKMGFFRTGKTVKIPFLFIFFFAMVFLQLRIMNMKLFIISMVNILLAMALLWGFLFLFHDNLKGFYTTKPELDLSEYGFTDRQLACIRGCLQRKKLKEIADEQIISESAIKREMLEIYKVFRVEDRHELYRLLSAYSIV